MAARTHELTTSAHFRIQPDVFDNGAAVAGHQAAAHAGTTTCMVWRRSERFASNSGRPCIIIRHACSTCPGAGAAAAAGIGIGRRYRHGAAVQQPAWRRSCSRRVCPHNSIDSSHRDSHAQHQCRPVAARSARCPQAGPGLSAAAHPRHPRPGAFAAH